MAAVHKTLAYENVNLLYSVFLFHFIMIRDSVNLLTLLMLGVIVCCSCFELHRVIIKVESEIKRILRLGLNTVSRKYMTTRIYKSSASPHNTPHYIQIL